MRPELLAMWEESGILTENLQRATLVRELEAHFKDTTPGGRGFNPIEQTRIMLALVKRYEVALCKIARKDGDGC
jgi:hypothetical protein